MSDLTSLLGREADPALGAQLEVMFAQYEGAENRAVAIHLTLQQVAVRARRELVLLAEVVYVAHRESVWSRVKHADGSAYESEDSMFGDLGLGSWRSIYRYIAAGRVIAEAPVEERQRVRASVEDIGVTKTAIIAPALERAADPLERTYWFGRAKQSSTEELQQHVNDAVRGGPRGYEAAKGERFRAYLINAAPSIEERETIERFFIVGAKVCQTSNPLGIFLAAVKDALAEWEVLAVGRAESPASPGSDGAAARG